MIGWLPGPPRCWGHAYMDWLRFCLSLGWRP